MSDNTGTMIAFIPPESVATALYELTMHTMPDFAVTPDQMHLTLVLMGEATALTPDQCDAIKEELGVLSERIAPLTGSINGITRFVDNDPNAIVANFDAPGLAELRATLITLLRSIGIEPTLNHGFSPHITLAYLPESQPMPTITLTPIPCVIDNVTLALGDDRGAFALNGQAELSEANKRELMPNLVRPLVEMDSFSLPAFKFGDDVNYPDVPLAPGVDLGELLKSDPDPLFVTRPLGVLGEISNNGLIYDDALLRDIEMQIISKKPGARQGHVSEETKSWEVPDDVGLWVGVLRVGDVLLGKCYILPGTHFNKAVRAKKAAGSTLSNSIYGKFAFVDNGDGTISSVGINLETIDFVPMERAALGHALGGKFDTTSEMNTVEGVGEMAGEHADAAADRDMLKKRVAEMKPEEVMEMLSEAQRDHITECRLKESDSTKTYSMLSEALRKGCAESYCAEMGMNMVAREAATVAEATIAEMQGKLSGVKVMEQQLSEMATTVKHYEREAFDREVTDAINGKFDHVTPFVRSEDNQRKLASLKANLRMYTVAEMAGSTKREEVTAAVTRAYDDPNFKVLAETTIASMAGPSAYVGTTTGKGGQQVRNGWDQQEGRYTDEFVQQALQMTGALGGRSGGAK